MTDEEFAEEIKREVAKAVAGLMKRVDSVRIFVTVHHPDGEETRTHAISDGDGNMFSQYGQVKLWVVSEEERERQELKGEEE